MNCLPGNHHCGSGPCNMLSNQFIKDIVYKELSQQVYQFRSGIEYKEQIDKEVQAFHRFIEGDKDEIIDREVAGQFNTLNHHLGYLNAIDKLVTQDSGVVTVNGHTRKTMAQIEIDAADSIYDLGEEFRETNKESIEAAIGQLGFVTIDSFELGATLTQRNQALRHAADGKLYRWAGDLPKVVPASSTPTSSGGMGDNAWLEVSDVTLRQDLANPNKGAAMVARSVIVADSVSEMSELSGIKVGSTVQTKGYYTLGDGGGNTYEIVAAGTGTDDGGSFINLSESGLQAMGLFAGDIVNVRQFGAKGNGVADDTLSIQSACDYTRRVIVPSGGVYVLSGYVSLTSGAHVTIDGTILIKESSSTFGYFPAGFNAYLQDGVTIDGSGTFSCERLIDIPDSEWLTNFNTGNLKTVGFAPHISIHGSSNCRVSGVSFYKTQGGVYIYRGHLPASTDWDFGAIVPAIPLPSGNVISGVSARFVVNASHAFREQTNAKLLNSYCYRSGDGGMYMQICRQSLISGNTRTTPYGDGSDDEKPIKTNDMQGISIEFCSDTIVSNNTVIGFLEIGIDVKRDCSNILVEGNLVKDCQLMSIAARGGDTIYGDNTGIVLSGNVIQNHGYTHNTYATYVNYSLKGAIHVSHSYSAIIRGNTVTGVNSTYGGNPIYAAGVKFSRLGFWGSRTVEDRISITNLVIENNTVNFPEYRANYLLDSTGFKAEDCKESGIKVLGLWGKVAINSNSLLANAFNPEIFSTVLSRAAIEVNGNSASELDSVSEAGIQQCSVCNNIINGWNAGGIYVNGGSNGYNPPLVLLVSGNSIRSLPGYGMLLSAIRGVNVTGNYVFDVGGNVNSVNRRGVTLYGCTYASFTNNTVLHTGSRSYDQCVRLEESSTFSANNTLQFAHGSSGPAVVVVGGAVRSANEGSNVVSN